MEQTAKLDAHQTWNCDPGTSAEDEPLFAASEGRHQFDIYTAKGGTRQVTKSTGIGSTETGLKPLWQQLIHYGPGRLAQIGAQQASNTSQKLDADVGVLVQQEIEPVAGQGDECPF